MVISLTKKNPEKKIHFKAFNSTYFELLKMMKENSDNNRDFKRFYNHNLFIKNTNIKMIIFSLFYHNFNLFQIFSKNGFEPCRICRILWRLTFCSPNHLLYS